MTTDPLPTELLLGGRAYDIVDLRQEDEESLSLDIMAIRAKEAGAYNGKEERNHVLRHKNEIPEVFRGQIVFVFMDGGAPDGPEGVYYVFNDRLIGWVGTSGRANGRTSNKYRALRRK